MTEETLAALERAIAELALSEARMAQRGRLADVSPLDNASVLALTTKRRRHVLVAIMVVGMLVMIAMLATGYVPLTGWSHNPAHEERWGLVVGQVSGAFCTLAWIFRR